MSANPAFKYPAFVVGQQVKVVKSVSLDASFIAEPGNVRAVHSVSGLNIEVFMPNRGHAALFAAEELEQVAS